jgi:predicted regulator of Ras-like GTPase activity (Roadblock/LC7/MglB family)
MFSFFKNLFSKKQSAIPVAPTPVEPVAPRTPVPVGGSQPGSGLRGFGSGSRALGSGLRPVDPNVTVPRVETAQLSLAAIMSKFPDELRKLVLRLPPPEAMIVLPIPLIQKYLPTGSVKMSLASVVRQAPPGTFTTINPQDKRLVEVPLAEIFKRISPALLKKRDDQKYSDLAIEGFDIFGDEENPYALAPRVDDQIASNTPAPFAAPAAPAAPIAPAAPAPAASVAPPASIPAPFARITPPQAAPAPAPAAPPVPLAATPPANIPTLFARQGAPAAPTAPAAPATPTPAKAPAPPVAAPAAGAGTPSDQPPLVMLLKELIAGWPEPFKGEAAGINGASVALPSSDIAAGLAKGKVAFTWGRLRSWIVPPQSGSSQGADSTELTLPLRVVAPAFLKHSKQGAAPRKNIASSMDIPELFSGGRPAAPAPAAPPDPAPAPESEPVPAPGEAKQAASEPETQPEPAPAAAVVEETQPTAEAPADLEPTFKKKPATPETAKPAEEAPAEEPAAPAAPELVASTPVAVPVAQAEDLPATVGELFGQPDKSNWSPIEIVHGLCEMPEIAGAVVALQEGLVIAHKLPEPLKGEVFAAFLPQIFARINQYSGEMKIGSVEDIVVNANGGQCHMFRKGQVFFAALSKPGRLLPTHKLHLCAEAVAS